MKKGILTTIAALSIFNLVACSSTQTTSSSLESSSSVTVSSSSETSSSTTHKVSREFKNALGKAKSYLEFSHFSDQGLYEQLIYEKFTESEAQYAIDNLE